MNMKYIIIFLISITILYSGNMVRAEGPAAKPASSVKIAIEPEGTVIPGETVQFTVTAYSQVDADDFRIWAELPSGIKFISGDLDWSGPVKKGEEYFISFTLLIPEKGTHVIKAGARIKLFEGTVFTDRAFFRIGKNIKKNVKGKNVLPGSFISDSKGIVEYELQ